MPGTEQKNLSNESIRISSKVLYLAPVLPEVKRLDENIVSILFKGTAKHSGLRETNIQKNINLDVKSTNPIAYESFIRNDEKNLC